MNGRQWDNNHTRYHCSDGSGSAEKLHGGSQGLYREGPLMGPGSARVLRADGDLRDGSLISDLPLSEVAIVSVLYGMSIPCGGSRVVRDEANAGIRHYNSGAEVFSAMYCRVHLFSQRDPLAKRKVVPQHGRRDVDSSLRLLEQAVLNATKTITRRSRSIRLRTEVV